MKLAKLAGSTLRGVFGAGDTYTSAVILAGGSGTRMPSPDGMPKQLRTVAGYPVLAHTLLAFERAKSIRETVVVVRSEDALAVKQLVERYKCRKVTKIVVGGATRSDSALAGFLAIDKRAKFVAIHDAARCLILPEEIDRVSSAAYGYRAATAVMPVYDTVKLLTEEDFLEKTLPRERVFLSATPQTFHTDLYRAAVYAAKKDGVEVTDDNMLIEHAGQAVKAVILESENRKITTEADLLYAETVLTKRKETR